jgi:hypothetical protein
MNAPLCLACGETLSPSQSFAIISHDALISVLMVAREKLLEHIHNDAGSTNRDVVSLIKDIDAVLKEQS